MLWETTKVGEVFFDEPAVRLKFSFLLAEFFLSNWTEFAFDELRDVLLTKVTHRHALATSNPIILTHKPMFILPQINLSFTP
jgi:hypothetical protein